jgi:hypothetical protein
MDSTCQPFAYVCEKGLNSYKLAQDTKAVKTLWEIKITRAFGWSTTSIGQPLFAIDWCHHDWPVCDIYCLCVCNLCYWPKCEKIEGSTDFSFLTQFLQFVWISNNKIHSIFLYFSHLSSENCEINSIKYYSPMVFKKHQQRPQILMHFWVLILFNFQWKNGSIINSFHTVAPNSLNSTPTIII